MARMASHAADDGIEPDSADCEYIVIDFVHAVTAAAYEQNPASITFEVRPFPPPPPVVLFLST